MYDEAALIPVPCLTAVKVLVARGANVRARDRVSEPVNDIAR